LRTLIPKFQKKSSKTAATIFMIMNLFLGKEGALESEVYGNNNRN